MISRGLQRGHPDRFSSSMMMMMMMLLWLLWLLWLLLMTYESGGAWGTLGNAAIDPTPSK
jgi:hypothetical protein